MSIHSIEPGFLLAAPRLGDTSFQSTIVLLGLHDGEGSLGWTINGPAVERASEIVRRTNLLPDSLVLPDTFDHEALRGGPVQPHTVWILYRRERDEPLLPTSIVVGEELAVSSSPSALEELVHGRGPKTFRLLLGYAGWSSGQLARELARGAWLPAEPDADLVFEGDPSTRWERAYSRAIGTIPQAFVATRGLS